MSMERIAAALHRVESILRRRPAAAVHEDAPALACWQSGTRVVTKHPDGASVQTDLPSELGGTGDRLTPGWLWRAALGSCLTTRIVMAAAAEGLDLTSVEVETRSRSDVRGLLGVCDELGNVPCSAPGQVQMRVRIAARGVSSERLQALVRQSQSLSPVQMAATRALPVDLAVEVLEH